MTGRITVLIADDHPVVRQGLQVLLSVQDDIDVIGEAADGCASAIRREGDSIKRWILPEVHHLASQCAGASRMKPAALKGVFGP